jgi:hypothetical protein
LRQFVTRGVVVFASLLAAPVVSYTIAPDKAADVHSDPRAGFLAKFFSEHKCPALKHTLDFLEAADKNNLDWRLLPSIALVESGGGRAYKNNNILGWGSAEQKFSSVRNGIHQVASRLANSKLYRNKDVLGILRTYNASAQYPIKVIRIMRSIAPDHGPYMLTSN